MMEESIPEIKSKARRRQAVLDLLSDENWHSTVEICSVRVGGSEGTRRLRELRSEVRAGNYKFWFDIEKRKKADSSQYEYKLIRRAVAPAQPQPMPLLGLMEAK